jgi:hypothetical protein
MDLERAQFIAVSILRLRERIDFLEKLSLDGHADEALILCCCYIESLSGEFYPEEKSSHRRFVRLLQEHGGNPVFERIVPDLSVAAFRKASSSRRGEELKAIAETLANVFAQDPGRMYEDSEFLEIAGKALDEQKLCRLKAELWRGSVASGAYDRIRCSNVHELVSPVVGLLFPGTIEGPRGSTSLGFETLYPALREILNNLRGVCAKAGAHLVF